jgi:hypothetical protein
MHKAALVDAITAEVKPLHARIATLEGIADARMERIEYLEGALRVIAEGTICPDLFPNDSDENFIAAKTAMVTAIAALEHSESETPAEPRPSFRGWIQSACENCGKLAGEHPQPNMWCYEFDRAVK